MIEIERPVTFYLYNSYCGSSILRLRTRKSYIMYVVDAVGHFYKTKVLTYLFAWLLCLIVNHVINIKATVRFAQMSWHHRLVRLQVLKLDSRENKKLTSRPHGQRQ